MIASGTALVAASVASVVIAGGDLPVVLAVGGVTGLLAVGGYLSWTAEDRRHSRGDLGRSLLVAGVIGIALGGAQFALDRRLRDIERERQARAGEVEERRTLQTSLGLQRDLVGIDLRERDLSQFFLARKNLAFANLSGASLRQTQLSNATLKGSIVVNADLRGADLRGATVRGAILAGSDLSRAELSGADLREVIVTPPTEVSRRAQDLSDSDVRATILVVARRRDDQLRAQLLENLRGRFGNDELAAAVIGAGRTVEDYLQLAAKGASGPASFRRAVLVSADLRRADLSFSDLSGADLSGADLREADLTGANLTDAILVGADLTDAIGTATDWPEDFDPRAAGVRFE